MLLVKRAKCLRGIRPSRRVLWFVVGHEWPRGTTFHNAAGQERCTMNCC
jgi:hypothetical protein